MPGIVFSLVKFNYTIELLLAETIFLFVYPKRDHFILRYILATLASISIGFLAYNLPSPNQIIKFIVMLVLIMVTVLAMFFSFKSSFVSIFSACIAGVALQHIGFHISRILSYTHLVQYSPISELICCIVLYVTAGVLLGYYTAKNKYYENYNIGMLLLSLVIVLVCIGITRFMNGGFGMNAIMTGIGHSLYAITCCSLSLFIQLFLYQYVKLKSDYLVLQRMNIEEKKQYELSKANAELLNIKYHDLKHKLCSLETQLPKEEIASMREIIDRYDNTYKTGFDILDIILNEKTVICRNKNISFTCMGDGKKISFMKPMDVYSMFGNIIENAMEAVEKITKPEQRVISMIIESRGDFVYINTINYTCSEGLKFSDGLPGTTKMGDVGYHGFGLKSVKNIAEKYNGGISVTVEDNVFSLSIYMSPSEI